MLNRQQLLDQIYSTLTKAKVVKLKAILQDQLFDLKDLIDLTFYLDHKIAFRAAWLLENIFLENAGVYLPDLKYLISKFEEVENASCARHYAKIAMHVTAPKIDDCIANAISKIDMECVVTACFNWLINPEIPVAVKSFAAQALFNLSPRYTWIRQELKEQLIFLMKNGSAAIQSRGNRLLSKL